MEDMESDSSGPDENPWPHLTEYVEFISRSGQQILFACKRYLPKDTKIKVHVSSLNNSKQHVRRVHESQYVQFEGTVKAGSNRGKTKGELILKILMMIAQVAVILIPLKEECNRVGS
ncbi:hypothetical protein JTB14_023064 [Gonioctena quinquepunctata]|nr:hypothetical protein JTB14_023064 [Gonioctena quinquepunctata]